MESTYNKYKRQNKEMKSILSKEVFDFTINKEDFQNRLNYLHQCMIQYRSSTKQR